MIYNAPSIYKQGGGGGGGGYKDGGDLVDGDFIKIENNTVSSYDNTTRSDVNFYFEVGDGEVINSVVELTTNVNATIHVYIVQNGLFIPLGNVGGDTVNSGDDYNLTIVGNSFILEVVTPTSGDPEYAIFGNSITTISKQHNVIWSGNINVTFSDSFDNSIGVVGRFYRVRDLINTIIPGIGGGWRLATKTELEDLVNDWTSVQLRSSTPAWSTVPNGTNESGMNITPCGLASGYNSLYWVNETGKFFAGQYDGRFRYIQVGKDVYGNDSKAIGNDTDTLRYTQCRLVKDV